LFNFLKKINKDPSLRMPLGSLLGFTFDAKMYETIADPSDCVVNVECTLKELYNGCKKVIKYER
jgi:DnaJ-class molecular chaperone